LPPPQTNLRLKTSAAIKTKAFHNTGGPLYTVSDAAKRHGDPLG
jgi:hypothetical protein